ncbi:DUF2272 domain-containing protein [uncultured Roseovarius sp.]|uniref:DUF2272 domain-containing protein n=1 Tax=uncultured Roseovarius sp. TaxID=293344 RepID=UPI00261ACACB|nr:DUF2272 domain-containing protein [uncultured Roseovarius sp.]
MTFNQVLYDVTVGEWDWFGSDEGKSDHYIDPDGNTTLEKKSGGSTNPRKETVKPYSQRIGDYWLSIPSKDYNKLVKGFAKDKGKLDGTVNLAWSAAFISYCMQTAGAGTSFPYSSGHYKWMNKAIRNRQKGHAKAALVGYRPTEIPLAVGDLLGKPRGDGVTYENAPSTGWYTSHSDIVVEIDTAAKQAFIIGGNVGQTVSRISVDITDDGRLASTGSWMVHIQNNITFPIVSEVQLTENAKVG